MTNQGKDDARRVRAVVRGESGEFEALVRRHLPAARAIAIAHLPGHADPEDVLQDAFLKAYEKLSSLRDPAKFGSWLLTITRHTAYQARETRRTHTPSDANPDELPDTAGANAPDPFVRDELDKLNEHSREVILLHYYSGYTTPEIAALLSLSDAAVRKRLQRAREELGRNLAAGLESTRPSDAVTRERAKQISTAVVTNAVLSTAGPPLPFSLGAIVPRPAIAIAATLGGVLALAGAYLLLRDAEERPVLADPQNGVLAAQNSDSIPSQTDSVEPVAIPARTNNSPQDSEAVVIQEEGDSADDPGENAEPVSIEDRLEKAVSLRFENVHIGKLLAFIGDTFEIQFLLDLRAIGGPSADRLVDTVDPPTVPDMRQDGYLSLIDIRDMTLLDALDLVATELGLVLVEEPGLLWLSSGAMVRRDGYTFSDERFSDYSFTRRYMRPVELDLDEIHVAEVFEFVSDNYEVNIAIDERVVRPREVGNVSPDAELTVPALPEGKITDGVIDYINLKNVQLQDCLRTLVRKVNLRYTRVDDHLWISGYGIDPPIAPGDRDAEAPDPLAATLKQPVGTVFEDVHIQDILDFLSDTYGLQIVLDQRVIAWDAEPAAAVNLWRPEAGGFSHEPVTHGVLGRVSVQKLPVSKVLQVFLAQLGLEYRVDDDRVWVSSPKLMMTRHTRSAWHVTPEEAVELVALVESGEVEGQDASDSAATDPGRTNDRAEPLLLRLQAVDSGEWRAEIDTGRSVTWVEKGDAVGRFEVLRITSQDIALEDAVTGETWQLRLETSP